MSLINDHSGYDNNPGGSLTLNDHDTARRLARAILILFALAIVLQYGLTAVLLWFDKAEHLQVLDKLFNDLLPVLAGLTGSATTYYFTRARDKD